MALSTRRDIAHAARIFARENGITEGHGSRGRVSKSVVEAFLLGSKPATVRETAAVVGIEVGKGKIKADTVSEVALAVTKNAPKEAGEAGE